MATGSFKGRSRVPFRSLSSLLREAMATYNFFYKCPILDTWFRELTAVE